MPYFENPRVIDHEEYQEEHRWDKYSNYPEVYEINGCRETQITTNNNEKNLGDLNTD